VFAEIFDIMPHFPTVRKYIDKTTYYMTLSFYLKMLCRKMRHTAVVAWNVPGTG